ncbi:hypothetical protein ACLB1E_23760 [Escherichia coli]
MAEELGWDIEAFDLALGEAMNLGMVKADIKARVFGSRMLRNTIRQTR